LLLLAFVGLGLIRLGNEILAGILVLLVDEGRVSFTPMPSYVRKLVEMVELLRLVAIQEFGLWLLFLLSLGAPLWLHCLLIPQLYGFLLLLRLTPLDWSLAC